MKRRRPEVKEENWRRREDMGQQRKLEAAEKNDRGAWSEGGDVKRRGEGKCGKGVWGEMQLRQAREQSGEEGWKSTARQFTRPSGKRYFSGLKLWTVLTYDSLAATEKDGVGAAELRDPRGICPLPRFGSPSRSMPALPGLAKCMSRPKQSHIVQSPNPIHDSKSTKHPPCNPPQRVHYKSSSVSLKDGITTSDPRLENCLSAAIPSDPNPWVEVKQLQYQISFSVCAGHLLQTVSADDLFKINRQRNRKNITSISISKSYNDQGDHDSRTLPPTSCPQRALVFYSCLTRTTTPNKTNKNTPTCTTKNKIWITITLNDPSPSPRLPHHVGGGFARKESRTFLWEKKWSSNSTLLRSSWSCSS